MKPLALIDTYQIQNPTEDDIMWIIELNYRKEGLSLWINGFIVWKEVVFEAGENA